VEFVCMRSESKGVENHARTADRTQVTSIRRSYIRLDIEYMGARRVRLHDSQPSKGHAERVVREDLTNARSKAGEERRRAGKVALLRGTLLLLLLLLLGRRGEEGHDAKREMQTAWIDDDGRVEALNRRFVREPGGRQRRHGAAEFWVMADGEGEEVGRSGSGRRLGVLLLVWFRRTRRTVVGGAISPWSISLSFRAR